jgi:hypothetical protein
MARHRQDIQIIDNVTTEQQQQQPTHVVEDSGRRRQVRKSIAQERPESNLHGGQGLMVEFIVISNNIIFRQPDFCENADWEDDNVAGWVFTV